MQILAVMQTKVIGISGDSSCRDLASLLGEGRISGVPVTSSEGELIGIVSRTDLMRKYTEVLNETSGTPTETLDATKVREIMSSDVVTVGTEEEIEIVADRMIEAGIHRVLVTDEDRNVCGIVSSWDLVRVIRLGDRLLGWNEPPNGSDSESKDPIQHDVVPTLQKCCAQSLPAMLVPLDDTAAYSALFSVLTDDSVVFAIPAEFGEAMFRHLAFCLVSFSSGGGTKGFFARVRELKHDPKSSDPMELHLELPAQILSTDRRSLFRIPVLGDHGLQVKLFAEDGESWSVTPIDIGMGGILLCFPVGQDPELPTGTQLKVELRLAGKVATLAGEVRHRRSGRYGLFFEKVSHRGEIVPSPTLEAIASVLEMRFLRQRGR